MMVQQISEMRSQQNMQTIWEITSFNATSA